MTRRQVQETLSRIATRTDDDEIYRMADGAIDALERADDPYTARVERFHDALREHGDEDYLTVLADAFEQDDLPLPNDAAHTSESALAEVMAERNRLFWAAFLAEESGEVASCLTSGEPPENFEEEVADVLILCHAIADVFGFSMVEAFHAKMDENDQKPKQQEGTGKLPAEARDDWRDDDD